MKTHSNSAAFYAFFGNFLITGLKFFGYLLSQSPSLFGEAIHSLADTANQGLLLIGIKRSKKKADANFTYGYGTERFFWAVISACGIFFVGAGVTVYHGIQSLTSMHVGETSVIIYTILGVSFLVEGFTLYKAYREILHYSGDSLMEKLENADPVSVAVFWEDLVAVMGVMVALASIYLTKLTGNHMFDAAGSIIIGLLLAVVAIFLINKNRQYILGKAIPEDVKEDIIEMLENDPHIDKVIDFRSEVLDIGRYHIKCEIEFNGSALLGEVTKNEQLEQEFENIAGDFEEFKRFIMYHTGRIPRIIGYRIDKIEKKIKDKYPEIEYIDLEIN